MHIVSSVFIESFEMRQAPGPATRIDLTGVYFSCALPSLPPCAIDPHLMALIFCPADESGKGVFEVVFRKGMTEDSEQLARNVSPFSVDPGKFTYRLVRGEIEIQEIGQIFAHCRVDTGQWMIVPLNLLPPAS
ncbi:MAG: hypothetical protein O3A24_00490 [Actinobacteria bacterium]|nr:hypothetical protein [Actinomycetota bacterium]MDA2951449.1 hypothetical protein [Actinomycetota bacterium]MDA2998366.1 hypothetical protein [Actinomycetota bacterium]